MDWLKGIGGKVATGGVVLAAIAGGISWWQMDLQTRHAILSAVGRLLGWGLGCLCLPWLLFGLVKWIARQDSNAAGAMLVLGLTAAEAAVLAALFHTALHGPTPWIFFAAGALMIGVYNLFTCDWIAEKMG